MALINENLLKISRKYIFPIIEERRDQLKSTLSKDELDQFVDLGVGDISFPISPTIVKGLKDAADEIGEEVIGYGPYQGYSFLRNAIVKNDYESLDISADEIFVSEGINSDVCGLQELFTENAKVGIVDPAYPVYYDISVLAGRDSITSLPLTEENGFMPDLPEEPLDLVFLTNPSNPTGVAMSKESLQRWVNWAKENECVIFYDAAYTTFIQEENLPQSIYEIDGAKDVAVEFKSFSKSSGFTGMRLGYCVIPNELKIKDRTGKAYSLATLWLNRQSTKTNGVSYPIQKAGLAALSASGIRECQLQVQSYLEGSRKILNQLIELGFDAYGGINSPYIWWKVPSGDSWEWFEKLIDECQILSVPGEAFGKSGEGYIRLSGFVSEQEAEKAVNNLSILGAAHGH